MSILFFSSFQEKKVSTKQKTDNTEFLGQWTLDIKGGSVGWLEVPRADGYIDADLLWEGGSVLPVPYFFMAGNKLYVGHDAQTVNRKRVYGGNESSSMMYPDWLEIQKSGDKIVGYDVSPGTTGIGADSTSYIGTKLPDVLLHRI